MSLPFLPLKPASTSGALDDPNLVASIVERVAAGDVTEACRLAVRWCGLTNDRRAQCNANSGLLWRQLTGAVFPTSVRNPTPAWLGANLSRPRDAVGKEWFYYLCKQVKAMKERREDYAYAVLAFDEVADRYYDENEDTELDFWYRRRDDWIMYQRRLARLEEKVHEAGHEYPQDVAERKSLLENIEALTKLMERGPRQMSRKQLLILTTRMRFQVEQEHMAYLFQFPKPEIEPTQAKANEAWSRQRRDMNARLQQMAGREVAAQRDSAQRFAVHRDSTDPREAALTALVRAAEARLNTTPMNVTYAGLDSAEQAELRRALNDLKYARYMGRTLRTYPLEINPKKAALERALAPLLD
jgi:hypothetical protein